MQKSQILAYQNHLPQGKRNRLLLAGLVKEIQPLSIWLRIRLVLKGIFGPLEF